MRYRVYQIQQMVDWFEVEDAESEAEALRQCHQADPQDPRWHWDTVHEMIREYVEPEEGQDARTVIQHYNHCQRKSKYPDEPTVMVYIRRREAAVPGLELEAYECKLCGHWHMAKKRVDGSPPPDMQLAGARS